jgi:hypothetical protein
MTMILGLSHPQRQKLFYYRPSFRFGCPQCDCFLCVICSLKPAACRWQAFLDRSSSILERALALSDSKWVYDVTVDYSAVTGEAWQPAGTKQNLLSPLVRLGSCMMKPSRSVVARPLVWLYFSAEYLLVS